MLISGFTLRSYISFDFFIQNHLNIANQFYLCRTLKYLFSGVVMFQFQEKFFFSKEKTKKV